MYFVTFYATDPAEHGTFERMVEVYPLHRAYADEFAKSGGLWMIGTFANPATEGSMAIFRSRAAAERFVEGDPFILEGLVHEVTIREWEPLEFPEIG